MSQVLLHVCDWNYQDRYYHTSEDVVLEFGMRIISNNIEEAWDWLNEQKDKGLVEQCDDKANLTLDTYFFDWDNPNESIADWSQED